MSQRQLRLLQRLHLIGKRVHGTVILDSDSGPIITSFLIGISDRMNSNVTA
jgi:hypothetical protein